MRISDWSSDVCSSDLFLRKSERQDALTYVHGGWIAALVAGLLTWIVATRFIAISGASRELTEGFGGILAALVLVSVGIWMHGKSHADAWQQYIQNTMGKALTKGSAWRSEESRVGRECVSP